MRRSLLVLLTALAALPTAAAAQFPVLRAEDPWGPRIRITPYGAVAPSFTRRETRVGVDNASAAVTVDQVDVSLGPGLATGVGVEGRVWQRFSLIGSVLWLRRGDTEEYSDVEGGFRALSGSDMFIGKAGVAMRLREDDDQLQLRSLSAALFVAPAVVVDKPREGLFSVEQDRMTTLGLNLGVEAEVPLAGGPFALQAQLEDFVLWWRDEDLSRRVERVNAARGRNVTTLLDAETSHMWLLRMGLSVRFH